MKQPSSATTSFKIAFIGAGSIGFTRTLLSDLMTVPEFSNIRISFMDISAANLDRCVKLCQRDLDSNGKKIKIHATTNQREAVKDARYIYSMFRVGGIEAFQTDVDIPLRYGIDQCVGDTLCAGGLMYAQRGIQVILGLCRDIRELAEPDALLMNYANPMAMLTWAANVHGKVRTIGLCHGVQGGHEQISEALGLPQKEVDIICAGINHQTWYISVKHRGEDMTGKILDAFENHPKFSKNEKVRIDMLRRFGYYSTESNGHLSEYVAWYRKRPEEIKEWIDLSSWINGETGGYLRVCTEKRDWFETEFPQWMKEAPKSYGAEHRSHEHGSYIVEGLETGRVYRGHFNVINQGVIANLPADAVIEAPGYVDRNGICMPMVGDLPPGCAAVCNNSISVQRLGVAAAVSGDDKLLRQAMMLDPLTGAVCNPPEIWQMVDELLVAQEAWLPQYKSAIQTARERLATGKKVPTRNYEGAARLKIKSVEEMRQDKETANAMAGSSEVGHLDDKE